jgi:hypothetical protein
MNDSFFQISINVIIPIITACIYFIMAIYIKKIAPLRSLITGQKTYKYGFLVFLLFSLFLIGRPLQILLGSHPLPLIISSIREFIMIGLLTPVILIGVLNHLYYDQEISHKITYSIFGYSIILGILFILTNIITINGSIEIFRYKFLGIDIIAHDGMWFRPENPNANLVPILFIIRLINPFLAVISVGILSFYKAIKFPKESIYKNLPKKYTLQGIALILFGMLMLVTGIMAALFGIQNQWYYLGALLAGLLELIGLSIPPRGLIIKNELKK